MKNVERMCIVCRKRMPKELLLRFTKNKSGKIAFDASKKNEGRGAWVCKNCVPTMIAKNSLSRAFKTNVCKDVFKEMDD